MRGNQARKQQVKTLVSKKEGLGQHGVHPLLLSECAMCQALMAIATNRTGQSPSSLVTHSLTEGRGRILVEPRYIKPVKVQ